MRRCDFTHTAENVRDIFIKNMKKIDSQRKLSHSTNTPEEVEPEGIISRESGYFRNRGTGAEEAHGRRTQLVGGDATTVTLRTLLWNKFLTALFGTSYATRKFGHF